MNASRPIDSRPSQKDARPSGGNDNQFTFAPNVTTATEKELAATLKLALARSRKLEDQLLGLCVTLEEEHGLDVGLLPADEPATSTQPPSPQARLDRLEDELDPPCGRCERPKSRHVPGPATPPKVAGHLGATEGAPGCCNDFELDPSVEAAPVIEQPHDFPSPQAEVQEKGS
jgi:hypothetical protein